MPLHLVDINGELVEAWRDAFKDWIEVTVEQGNLLDVAKHCVISPANSYGFMDGGIDAAYRRYFGVGIEEKVRSAIAARPEGMLPVGASLVVRTGHLKIPFLIVAPTMTMPEDVGSENCYRAMRAALRMVESYPDIGKEVYCPGLATGVGGVASREAAKMMARAYRDWRGRLCNMK